MDLVVPAPSVCELEIRITWHLAKVNVVNSPDDDASTANIYAINMYVLYIVFYGISIFTKKKM